MLLLYVKGALQFCLHYSYFTLNREHWSLLPTNRTYYTYNSNKTCDQRHKNCFILSINPIYYTSSVPLFQFLLKFGVSSTSSETYPLQYFGITFSKLNVNYILAGRLSFSNLFQSDCRLQSFVTKKKSSLHSSSSAISSPPPDEMRFFPNDLETWSRLCHYLLL